MKIDSQNLILFGYKASGKTFFGKLLACELNIPFIDTDLLIEKMYQETFQEEYTCKQIFFKIGIQGFRELEEKVIEELKDVSGSVIALGGGAVLNPENCKKLKQVGKLVYLELDKSIIKQRIFLDGVPLFLDSNDPHHSFEKMHEERKSVYESVSPYKVNLDGKNHRCVLDELMAHARCCEE